MNLLFIIGWPLGQGGHINSTYTLLKDIIKLGVSPTQINLISPKGEKLHYFKKLGINYHEIKNSKNLIIYNIELLSKIIYVSFLKKISIIHALDYKSLKPSVISNIFLFKKLIFTKAGGKPIKNHMPSLSGFIVFSRELEEFYNNSNLNSNKITLIKERLDLQELVKVDKPIAETPIIIFMAMRFNTEKQGLIDNLFREIKLFKNKNRVIVNIAGDGELSSKYKLIGSDLLKRNKNLEINFLGEINDKKIINQYNNNAHIIVGHGRGIMEAMAIGKPVVMLGFNELGSSLINETNVQNAMDYNFSGRNILINQKTISLSYLVNSKGMISTLGEIGIFNKKYIYNNYDSKVGADKTLKLYSDTNKFSFKHWLKNILWLLKKIRFGK